MKTTKRDKEMNKILIAIESFVEKFRNNFLSVASWLPAMLLVGLCLGLSTWLMYWPEIIGSLGNDNNLDNGERYNLLYWILICICTVYVLYIAGHRHFYHKSDIDFSTFAKKINRYAVTICIVPIFIYLRTDDLGKDFPFFSIAAVLSIGMIGAYVTYHLADVESWSSLERKQFRRMPFIIVALLALSYAVTLSYFHVLHHQHLGTKDWDLALYINSLWQSLRGNFLGCSLIPEGTHIARHFDPILVLISPILLICNRAETLLVFQASWIASGAIPLFLLAKHRLGNPWYGIALSLVYLFHPAIHGQNMYDFHSIVLAGPVLLWCMYCLESERIKAYYVLFAFLLLIREDTAVLASMMALYLIISGKMFRVAGVTILISAAYALFANKVMMGDSTHSYDFYFEGIKLQGHSPGASIVISIFTNPGYVLRYALAEERVLYILKLLIPIMALPLFSKKHYILYIWGLGMTFFGSWGGFVQLGTQYSVYWLPFMLASVPHALDNIGGGRLVGIFNLHPSRIKAALTVGMVLCAVSMSSLYGAFWTNSSFRPGYSAFERDTTPKAQARYETVKKVQSMVPDNASVIATRHLCPHFSLRNKIWTFSKRLRGNQNPDYALIWDEDKPRKQDKSTYKKNVVKFKEDEDYQLILHENDIRVYKRKR